MKKLSISAFILILFSSLTYANIAPKAGDVDFNVNNVSQGNEYQFRLSSNHGATIATNCLGYSQEQAISRAQINQILPQKRGTLTIEVRLCRPGTENPWIKSQTSFLYEQYNYLYLALCDASSPNKSAWSCGIFQKPSNN